MLRNKCAINVEYARVEVAKVEKF